MYIYIYIDVPTYMTLFILKRVYHVSLSYLGHAFSIIYQIQASQ